uniref:Integrase catalytic domain-containing protein n=1 Tax=Oreochromis niloticus TaxID=8128 RepID=A0A669C4E2_ORENI
MAWRIFISRCKNILNDCTRRLLIDDVGPDVLQLALRRLETMQRSLQWARGRLINVTAADQLLRDLAELIQEVELSTQHGQQGCFGYQAPVVFNRGRGRSLYLITREQLSFLKSCGFTAPQMADILNVSLPTIRRRLRQYHFTRASMYAELTDSALDEHVQDIVAGNEQTGPEAVRASLRVRGLRVQRRRVRASMLRMNPGAAALRAVLRRPERRTYQVAGPNSLWHIDGNHKLIRWRIVIHGAIDGYSRLVVFLHASNNNRSSTVLSSFIRAVVSYGVPSRVRTDRGGENNAVCLMMNIFRGFDRGSALRGRSTHNQRIERLWGDLWRGMTNVYCDLFHHLEEEGIIDIDNEMHLWALHYIYLPRINRDLKDFTQQWNNHGLRTERHLSPLQIFVQGSLQQQGRASTAMQDIFQTRAAAAAGTIGGTADGSVTATESETTAAQGLGTDSGGGAHGTDELGLLVDWPERINSIQFNFSIQFYLYSAKSQQKSPQGALYCTVDSTIINTEKNPTII